MGIRGIHVLDGHDPGQIAGRLRDRELGSVIGAVDGDGDGLGDLVAGAVGNGDLVEALGHGLTIRQMVHVLCQLIPVLAGLGIKVQGTVLSCDHLPDLAVDGYRLGALSRVMQRIVMGPVRAAIPAFGCDGLLCRGFRLFRHIDRQAPLVGYLRHAVAALDVDREFLFGDAAVAVIHHHGDLGINHIRRTQVLYRVESIIQLETVGTGFFVDIEGAVVGLVGIFARFFRKRPLLQAIAQRIVLIHIRGRGVARDRRVRTFLDGQHRLVQRQHRSVVGTVDGDGNGLCHFRTILVLDEDGEGLLQGLAVFSQFLYCLHLVVELIAVGTVRIDEKGTVLPGSHIAGVAACCALTGSHGITQIAFIYAVVRNVELVPDRDGGIFRGLKRELTAIDHRGFVGTRDGDMDRVRNGTVLLLLAIIHGDLQVEFLFFPLRQAVSDIFIGREGIAAVLIQRERAQDLSVLLDRIGRGTVFSNHFVCQRDALCLIDTVCEGLRSIFRNFRIAYVLLIRVRGPDPAFSDTARILDLKIFDRLDDRLVIDALDSHRDRESPMFPDPYLKVQRDRGVFIQLLDSLAAVIEHEAVAPLAIFALFQDQRAEVGLDHMRLIAVSVRQPDLIGRDVYRGSFLGFQREGAAFHMRRQGDIVLAVVFCHFRHIFRGLKVG